MSDSQIIGIEKDYRVESCSGKSLNFWADQFNNFESVEEVWKLLEGTRFDASFPGFMLRLNLNPISQPCTVGYRVHINGDQNDPKGCHIKVGWALEGAYHHPGVWDSAGWSIGGRATLVHGGDAATGRMGYCGSTSMYVDGKVQPARFSRGDVIETYCIRYVDMIYMLFFVNGRRVHRGKSALGCSPHVFKVNEMAGRCLVPAIAGGINFGSWWVSLELLCEGDLPLPPLELTPGHHTRVVAPRPGSHWQCDECKAEKVQNFHGCLSCEVWLCDSCNSRSSWVSDQNEFRRVGSTWIEYTRKGAMITWGFVPVSQWPPELEKWQDTNNKQVLLQCSGDLPSCKCVHSSRRDDAECTAMVFLDGRRLYSNAEGPWHTVCRGFWVATKHDVQECTCNVPKSFYKEMSPLNLRFTHDCISSHFRGRQESLDEVVDQIAAGDSQFADLPPMDVVSIHGRTWSLSNRRLYVARVLAHKRVVATVRVCEHSPGSAYLTNVRHCEKLNRLATKWERSFSTTSEGMKISCRSLRDNGGQASLRARS